VRISAELRDELLAAARAEAPNECCGLLGLRDDAAARYWPVANDAASPLRFEMNGAEQYAAWKAIEDEGLELAIFHSHTRSAPRPSQTDINMAALWPGSPWIIAGVSGEPELRAWRIDGATVEEIPLTG
jgi:proteasome lid subunit RPN8/RPN11